MEGGKTKRKRAFECVVSLLAERMAPSRSRTRSRASLESIDLHAPLESSSSSLSPCLRLPRMPDIGHKALCPISRHKIRAYNCWGFRNSGSAHIFGTYSFYLILNFEFGMIIGSPAGISAHAVLVLVLYIPVCTVCIYVN